MHESIILDVIRQAAANQELIKHIIDLAGIDLSSKRLWTARLQPAKTRPASVLDRSNCMPQPGSCTEAEFASGYLDNLFKSCCFSSRIRARWSRANVYARRYGAKEPS